MQRLRQGTVTEVSDTQYRVKLDACGSGGAGGCGACGGGCGGHGGGGFQGSFEVTIPAEGQTTKGDRVELEVDTPSEALVSLVLFGFPLASAIGGGFTGHALTGGSDTGLVGGLVVGLVAGFVLVAVLSRTIPSLTVKAKLVRVLRSSPAPDA